MHKGPPASYITLTLVYYYHWFGFAAVVWPCWFIYLNMNSESNFHFKALAEISYMMKTNSQQEEQSHMMWTTIKYIVDDISCSLFINSWNRSDLSAFPAKSRRQNTSSSIWDCAIYNIKPVITGSTGSSGLWILDA